MINRIPVPPVVMDPSRLAALDAYAILDTAAEQGFEDIVHLATQLCAVPVALVSLVDQNRQWFKARIGFPTCETDLDRSVCKFVLEEPHLLIIPDLTADPRRPTPWSPVSRTSGSMPERRCGRLRARC
jgi:GAF domain-containing protein